LACVIEVTAPKLGNVHRGADFADVTYADFVSSALAIGPVFENAEKLSCGELVLAAIKATRVVCCSNTNLGTILLFAPLAKAATMGAKHFDDLATVLESLTSRDAELVYEAIQIAKPGGLGAVERGDVAGPAPSSLMEAMRDAAQRDLVARQYANGFQEVSFAAEQILAGLAAGLSPLASLVKTQLELMSVFPDSLIVRKCGPEVARQAVDHAAEVLNCGPLFSESFWQAASDLDFWLRSAGNRRNPGTTADLLAAGLFMLLWKDQLPLPLDWSMPGEL
jgi:triphosphoribosyl-dephospho-CoA synthase